VLGGPTVGLGERRLSPGNQPAIGRLDVQTFPDWDRFERLDVRTFTSYQTSKRSDVW